MRLVKLVNIVRIKKIKIYKILVKIIKFETLYDFILNVRLKCFNYLI